MTTSPMAAEFDKLIRDVQVAHRLSVGFYQRLLPIIRNVASSIDCTFRSWCPCETNRPAKSTTQPGEKWAWDFVPLFASQHVYFRTNGGPAKVGDLALVLDVYLDANFKEDARAALGAIGQPDPIKLPQGDAIVDIYVYRCIKTSKLSLEILYEDAEWPSLGSGAWDQEGEHLSALAMRYSLRDFVACPENIVSRLQHELSATIA